jgi:hypothetical protein
MSDQLAAVVIRVPDECFPDDDDICLTASRFVCSRLESHLIQHGHTIADWIRGGCDEDWGVYLESQCDAQTFEYIIGFFPSPSGETQNHIVVQYHLKVPFLKRLFKKREMLDADHRLHESMREFGKTFASSRLLTQSQFDAEI